MDELKGQAEQATKLAFEYKIKQNLAPPSGNVKRYSNLIDHWADKIHKGMGLKIPYKLHIIDHDGVEYLYGKDLEDPTRDKVTIFTNVFGRYYLPEYTECRRDFHHIIARIQPTYERTVYLLAHELQHAKQCEVDYGYERLRYLAAYQKPPNYATNPFEIEARRKGCEWAQRLMGGEARELLTPFTTEMCRKGEGNMENWSLYGLSDFLPQTTKPREFIEPDRSQWLIPAPERITLEKLHEERKQQKEKMARLEEEKEKDFLHLRDYAQKLVTKELADHIGRQVI